MSQNDIEKLKSADGMAFSWIFGSVSSLVTVVSSWSVLMSLAFDWGYFDVVGVEYMSMMTIGDHLSSFMQFLPSSLLSFSVGALAGTLAGPDYWKKGVEVPQREYRVAVWRDKVRWHIWLIVVGSVSFGFLGFFLYDRSNYNWVATTLILIPICVSWVTRNLVFLHDISISMLLVISLALGFMVTEVTNGLSQGNRDLRLMSGPYKIVLHNQNIVDGVALLRYLEKGLLVKRDRVIFLPYRSIESLEKTVEVPSRTPRICAWFGYCDPWGQRFKD